ncbi:MAG: glycosyltransferase [Thermoplasmata archaeon]|nr:glycosyltransferase [Thermoplasmata archaeon]
METKTFLFTTSFYPPYHIGGDAMHVAYLAEELVGRGHEVHVLHSIDAYRLKTRRRQFENTGDDGIFRHPSRSPFGILSPLSAYALGKSAYVSKKLDAVVEETSPDIVHHHNISLLGSEILRKRDDYLNIHTAHDYWLLCPRNDMMYRGNRICTSRNCVSCTLLSKRIRQPWRNPKRLQSILRELDLIIAPSKTLHSHLTEELNGRVSHICNFAPEPPARIARVDINDFFLYVGVLEKHKGINILIDAFEEADIDSKLVVVGDGKFRDHLVKKSRTDRLKGRVFILGQVNHHLLYGLYRKALALVLPSICLENCPLVILEALSMGTPVLGSDTGGVGDLVRLSRSGIVNCPNPGNLRESLERMASNGVLRKNLSKNAKNSYSRLFSPQAFMRAYGREIDKLI